MTIGYLANIALAAGLLIFAGTTLTLRNGRGGLFLGCFLATVGLNYLFDGLRVIATELGADTWAASLQRAGLAMAALDPALLLLFAWTEARGARLPRWHGIFLLIAGVLVVAVPSAEVTSAWRWAFVTFLVLCYAYALALLLEARLRSGDGLLRARLDSFVLALGPVILTRLPLVYTDLGLARGITARAATDTLIMDLGLALGVAAIALFVRRRSASREEAMHLVLPFAALTFIIGFVWILRFVPALQATAFAFLYSVRWFVFIAVYSRRSSREWVFGQDVGRTRHLPVIAVALLASVGVAASSSTVAALTRSDMLEAILSGTAIAGSAVLIVAAARRAFPGTADPWVSRRISIYRAQLELGTGAADLENLRRKLGISEDAARQAAALALLERQHAPKDRIEPGIMFLGLYRVEHVLGVGTFGRVWAAREADGTPVVIKELREEWQQDTRAAQRFVREIRTATRISHPNLVQFRALERTAFGLALVLSRVPGETLRSRMARGPLRAGETEILARDLAAGLAVLHDAGLVHRDVKPENVMITPEGRAVLLDLGASVDSGGTGTQEDSRTGTPAYMAPEQRDGQASARSDVYAVGVIVREALSMDPGEEGSDARWALWMERCLSADPKRRFASAREMALALPGGRGNGSPLRGRSGWRDAGWAARRT